MKENIVVIKIYRGFEACGDWQDIHLDEYARAIRSLKDYGKEKGLSVLVSILDSAIDADSFAEVSSATALDEDVKTNIAALVRSFLTDACPRGGEMTAEVVPFTVLFYSCAPYAVTEG